MRYQLRHIQIWTAKISIISEYSAFFLKISRKRGNVVLDRLNIDQFVQQGIDGQAGKEDAAEVRHRKKLQPWVIVLIVLAALVALFIAASYLFTDFMSPVLDRLLYNKEELELLRGR